MRFRYTDMNCSSCHIVSHFNNSRKAWRLWARAGLSTTAVLMSMPALAQEQSGSGPQLEDIVVTAQKRAENLQKVPVSVVAFSGAALDARNARSLEDISISTSGLVISNGGGSLQPFLRGVGQNSATMGQESSVALYVDGQYFTRLPIGSFSLNNVQRVEVLKGPQGTLFGRNASGGVIQIITQDPSHTPSVKSSLSYGNYNTFEGNLYATAGITDKIAGDIALSGRRQQDGYGINLATGNRTSYVDYFTARSKWLFEASEDTRFILSGYYSYSKNSFQGSTLPGTTNGFSSAPFDKVPLIGFYDQNEDVDAYAQGKTWGVSLKAEQQLSFAQLTSITGYMKTIYKANLDSDYTERPDFQVSYGGPVKQFTQELQLASLPGEPLTWTIGGFYYNTTTTFPHATFCSPNGTQAAYAAGCVVAFSKMRAKSYAVYGQSSYEILPRLKITGGLRYTADRTSAYGYTDRNTSAGLVRLATPAPNSLKNDKVTFKAAADYQLTDRVLTYASFSRGFKSAVFNLLTYNRIPNKPEITDAYEVGLKSELFDRRLRLNLAGFWYDIKNPQTQLVANGVVVFSNAGASRSRGIDMDAELAISPELTLRGNATYMQSKYTDYTNAPAGPQNPNAPYGAVSPLISVNANGNYTVQAPKITFDIGTDYTIETSHGKIAVTADYYYNGGFYWQADNMLKQKRYGLLNGQIKYMPTDNVGIRIWGKNLTDKKYATREVTTAGPAGFTYQAGAPQTYGIGVDLNF
jgi:iron complex outermembrane recepter protein